MQASYSSGGTEPNNQMPKQTITVVETCRVCPPAGSAADQILPLTFFDLPWLHFHPMRLLLFYDVVPCEETLIPKLKQSLSLALGHYFPLAGCLAYPAPELAEMEKPVIRCTARDSVPFTIAVAELDGDQFENLVGNHRRDADQFYDFIPETPPLTMDEESCPGKLLQAVLAVQVTLFPGRGMCVGIANHHVSGDAASIVGFIKSWTATCRREGEGSDLLRVDEMPVFERSVIREPPGVYDVYWNHVKQASLRSSSLPWPTHRVRATFLLHKADINKLKGLLLAQTPGFVHASSFVVTTAYIWVCLGKSIMVVEDCDVDDDAEEFLLFLMDCRARLDPPVPENYFGNCLLPGLGKLRHRDLVGDDGFILAAEALAKEIRERINRKENLLDGVEGLMPEIQSAVRKRTLAVSGSVKVDLYNADFGWGKVRKQEMLSIDEENYAMSLCRCREFDDGIDISLSLPESAMDAFAAAFSVGLL